MSHEPENTGQLMERASQALAQMDYLACEALCIEALHAARDGGDWTEYARILLPLQECRRQRRMIAAEGAIRLGTTGLDGKPLSDRGAACIVVTHPHTAEVADQWRAQHQYVEVLFADNTSDAGTWTLRSTRGPAVTCDVAVPPSAWIDAWLDGKTKPIKGKTPADWFIDATEALGDAALDQSDDTPQGLEACLDVVTDHEILHQRLGAAARSLAQRG